MIFQTDVFLKSLLESTLQDIRNNIWLMDYILDDFTKNPLLKSKYGKKQVDAAKQWFLNNNINVFHQYVKDKEKFPCIVIVLGSSQEVQEMRTMGDVDTDNIILLPSQVGQTIPYVVKPFSPLEYDLSNGEISVPLDIDISAVAAGMVLVNPENGTGSKVLGINGQTIIIESNVDLKATQLGVIPQQQFFTSRLGRSFFQENWNLVAVTNDPSTLLWLHSIMIFALLRYREYMESNGVLEITNLSSTDIYNPDISKADGEEMFARQVTVQNKVKQTFIRGLHRSIESVLLRETVVSESDPCSTSFEGGIHILSNKNTDPNQLGVTNWDTIEDDSDF